MRILYREEHRVFVDFEIDIEEEDLIEAGVDPYDNDQVSGYIKSNFSELQPEPEEWWVSLQHGDYVTKVGIRPDSDVKKKNMSEDNIDWIG